MDVSGSRCLVIDDNEINREIFRRQLTPWGIEVVTACSADSALAELVKAAALGREFDAAIVDQHMPSMSGTEFARVVRAMPMFKAMRLILATSGAASGEEFDRVFSKPVRPNQLLSVLSAPRVVGTSNSAAPKVVARSATRAGRSLRVLVVEDNYINQKVASGYLQKEGCRVDIASDGLEALAAVRARPYDIIFMDVHMPEMDGLTATRSIRALEGDRGSVVIVGLTASAMREDHDACLAAGMDDYLSKPINRAKLLQKLDSCAARAVSAAPASRSSEEVARKALDRATLDELGEALGHSEICDMLGSFGKMLSCLERNLATLNRAELQDQVHQVRGSFWLF